RVLRNESAMGVDRSDTALLREVGGALQRSNARGTRGARDQANGFRAVVEIPNHRASSERHGGRGFHTILVERRFQRSGKAGRRFSDTDLAGRKSEAVDARNRGIGSFLAPDTDDHSEPGP